MAKGKKNEEIEKAEETKDEIKEEKVVDKEETTKEKADDKKEKEESKEEKLEKELTDQKDKYLRLCAEYDNYRKRTQNEKLSIYDDATIKAVEEILPIADSITMALATLDDSEENSNYKKGIELIAEQLKKSFEKLQVTQYGEIGDKFDVEIHNAVGKIEDENLGENEISAVYQKGFKLKDKVIRHAMVQVANCD